MNLNILAKERTDVISELEKIKELMSKENRALTKEEIDKVEELKGKVENLNASIRFLEEDKENTTVYSTESLEERVLNEKLLDMRIGDTMDLAEFRAVGLSMTSTNANGGEKTIGLSDTAKGSFANEIIGSVTKTSGVFDAIKKITLPSALHQLPVSRKRVGKFVGVAELEEYTRNTATIEPVILEPSKLGTIVSFSKELVKDYGYNIEGYIVNELSDALAETLDEIIVKGLSIGSKKIEGLESFNATSEGVGTDGSHGVAIENGVINIDILSKIYHTLPSKYRSNATWVISDRIAENLTNIKDANGNPILVPNYNVAPFGSSYTLFGRPVIVNSFVSDDLETNGEKVLFFGDLTRALVFGIRDSLEIIRSEEIGFIRDEILIKAMTRFDIKKAQSEAIAVGVVKVED